MTLRNRPKLFGAYKTFYMRFSKICLLIKFPSVYNIHISTQISIPVSRTAICSAAAHWHLSCSGRNLKSAQVELHLDPDVSGTPPQNPTRGLSPLSWPSRILPMASFCTSPPFFVRERVCLAAWGTFCAARSVSLIKIKPSF